MVSETSPTRRFFVFQDDAFGSHDTRFSPVNPHLGDAPRCPRCGQGRGARSWLPPFQVELEPYGTDWGDVATGPGGDLLVSRRFRDAYHDEGLVGLRGFDPMGVVRVLRKRRGPSLAPPSYFLATPDFSEAAVDEARSRLDRPRPFTCDGCRLSGLDAIHGFCLEQPHQVKEDIFRPRALAGTLVASERFARFVARHALTNMRLTPTEQFVWDPLRREPDRLE